MQNSHSVPTETGNGCLLTSYIPAPLSSSRLKHDAPLFLCKSQHEVQFLISLRSHPLLCSNSQPLSKAGQYAPALGQHECTKEPET